MKFKSQTKIKFSVTKLISFWISGCWINRGSTDSRFQSILVLVYPAETIPYSRDSVNICWFTGRDIASYIQQSFIHWSVAEEYSRESFTSSYLRPFWFLNDRIMETWLFDLTISFNLYIWDRLLGSHYSQRHNYYQVSESWFSFCHSQTVAKSQCFVFFLVSWG